MGRKEAEKRRIERHQKATKVNKHNDRNFDLSLAEHIDQSRLNKNLYWNFYTNRIYTHEEKIKENILSFSDAENAFYDTNFVDGLNAKNERYIKNRHKERVQTMQQYQYHEKTCPLETIFQFGDKSHKIPMGKFQQIFLEQIEWEQKTFPNVVIVDWAIHGDETVDHAHTRAVFKAHDKDGHLIVNKTKALKEMGLERPDLSKKPSRYNNVMITYTQMCRDNLLEVCKKYGLDDINYEPQKASKSGKTLQQYQYEEDKKKMKELVKRNEEIQEEGFALADQNTNLQLDNQNLIATNQDIKLSTQEMSKLIVTQQKQIDEQQQAITDATAMLNKIQAEAKEAYYLKESLQKEIEPMQSIIDRYQKMEKQYDKKIKSSKLHPDYWLVHDDIITDYLNVRSQAGQVLADQEALDKRKKVIEERERQIQHYQYINNSNESLNRQLREKLNSLDWQLKKEKEQAYEQALIDASRALGKSVTVIKSAIELFSHDEMEEEYEY